MDAMSDMPSAERKITVRPSAFTVSPKLQFLMQVPAFPDMLKKVFEPFSRQRRRNGDRVLSLAQHRDLQQSDICREAGGAIFHQVLLAKAHEVTEEVWLSLRLITTRSLDHPDWQARAAGSAGSRRAVLHRIVRALSTLGASAGGGAGGDVRARGFDP